MYDTTVYHDFSISLIAPEDCCFTNKLSSTTSCYETQNKLHELFGAQLLAVLFHKLMDIIVIHLQSHYLSQRHTLVDYRLHSYCLKPLKVTFDNAFRRKLLPGRSQSSLSDPLLTHF
ncbi:hypothetical protein AVEN_186404-1 [Araneus ventricosus]|uniref:Uncharacterized protein n=1 Tax=Araneus ventricosus TaxID=182803 RepID=A0A4Y2D0R6_ARAVE|nr:hypothetical protein AVEN_186404-1 [Araneus ventricosus]